MSRSPRTPQLPFRPQSLVNRDSKSRDFRDIYRGRDIDDIRNADALICFTEGNGEGGARHVELGIGLGLNKRVYIVGEVEHLFHTLPQLKVYPKWSNLLHAISQ